MSQMCNPANSNTGIYNSRTNNSLLYDNKTRLRLLKVRFTSRRLEIQTADDESEHRRSTKPL